MTFDNFKRNYKPQKAFNRMPMVGAFIVADLVAAMVSFGSGFFNTYDLDIINFKSFITYWPYLPAFLVIIYIFRLYPGLNLAHAEELRRFALTSFLTHNGIILSRIIISKEVSLDPYSIAFMLSWLCSIIYFPLFRSIVRRIFAK